MGKIVYHTNEREKVAESLETTRTLSLFSFYYFVPLIAVHVLRGYLITVSHPSYLCCSAPSQILWCGGVINGVAATTLATIITYYNNRRNVVVPVLYFLSLISVTLLTSLFVNNNVEKYVYLV